MICQACKEKMGIGHIVVSSLRAGHLLLCTACKYQELLKISKTGSFFNRSVAKRELKKIPIAN